MHLYIFCILIITVLTTNPAHAYIDPGTGSMLFSVVLCSLTTVFFLFGSLVIRLKRILLSEKKLSQNKYKFVIYSEGNQYYSVFKPVLDEFEKRQINVVYYTSSEDDPNFKESYNYVNCEYIGKGNKAYFKLAFLNADVCLMTTPQLDVLQLKRSKKVKHYSHILHSIGFAMIYRLFSLDYYDSVLCDAQYQIPMIREIEQKRNLPPKKLPVVGSTYMDYNKQRLPRCKNNETKTILIAPSWGKDCILNKFGEKLLDRFCNTDFSVIIRPHPQSLLIDKDLIKKLQEKYNDFKNIRWDLSNNNLDAMSQSDILISDFSGIMMDYAFLFKRPFAYIDTKINYEMYDCSELDEKIPWKYKIAEKIGKKLEIENGDIENIVEIIQDIIKDPKLTQNIEEACNYAWEHQGEAAARVVDFLTKIQEEASPK